MEISVELFFKNHNQPASFEFDGPKTLQEIVECISDEIDILGYLADYNFTAFDEDGEQISKDETDFCFVKIVTEMERPEELRLRLAMKEAAYARIVPPPLRLT